jgi:hypothetical protein
MTNSFFSHLITCPFATRINSCKSSWKDGMRCPMAYEPPSKSQKQLHFHIFWNAIKNGWYKFVFHFHFHPNASISCIYKNKSLCNHLCDVTKCHEGQLYLKLQKWLIWTQVAKACVGMDMIPYSEKKSFI